MQLRNQARWPRDWKVVAGIATAATIGIGGLAIASPNDDTPAPEAIDLQDKVAITEVTVPATLPPTDFTVGSDDDATEVVDASADLSPESADSPDESIDDTPLPADDDQDDSAETSDQADDSPEASVDESPEASVDDSDD